MRLRLGWGGGLGWQRQASHTAQRTRRPLVARPQLPEVRELGVGSSSVHTLLSPAPARGGCSQTTSTKPNYSIPLLK